MDFFSNLIGRGLGAFNSTQFRVNQCSPLHPFRRDVFNRNAPRFRDVNTVFRHAQQDTCSGKSGAESVETLKNVSPAEPLSGVDTQQTGNAECETTSHLKLTESNAVRADSPAFKQEQTFRKCQNERPPCDAQPGSCSTTRRTELVEILRNLPPDLPMRGVDAQAVGPTEFNAVQDDLPGFKQEERVRNVRRSSIPQSAAVSTAGTSTLSDRRNWHKNTFENIRPHLAPKTQRHCSSPLTKKSLEAQVEETTSDHNETTGEEPESSAEERRGYSVIQTDATGFRVVTARHEKAKLASKSPSVRLAQPETDSERNGQQRSGCQTEPGPHSGRLPGVLTWPRRLFRFAGATFGQARQRTSSFVQQVRRLLGTAFQTARTGTAGLLDAAQTEVRNALRAARERHGNRFFRLVAEVPNVAHILNISVFEILISSILCGSLLLFPST